MVDSFVWWSVKPLLDFESISASSWCQLLSWELNGIQKRKIRKIRKMATGMSPVAAVGSQGRSELSFTAVYLMQQSYFPNRALSSKNTSFTPLGCECGMKEKHQKILSSTTNVLTYHISHLLIFKFLRGQLLEQTDLQCFSDALACTELFTTPPLNNSKSFWCLSIPLSFVDGLLEQPSLQHFMSY